MSTGQLAPLLRRALLQLAIAPALGMRLAAAQPAPGTSRESDQFVAFLARMQARTNRTGEDLAAINAQFAANRIDTVIQPANLVSRQGLQASRKKLDTHRTLIARRSNVLWQHFSDMEGLVRSSGLSERDARAAMTGADANRAAMLKAWDELGQAQLSGARAMDDLLAFAQRNLGHTATKDAEMVFESPSVTDDYRRVLKALDVAARSEAAATRKLMKLLSPQKSGGPGDKRRQGAS